MLPPGNTASRINVAEVIRKENFDFEPGCSERARFALNPGIAPDFRDNEHNDFPCAFRARPSLNARSLKRLKKWRNLRPCQEQSYRKCQRANSEMDNARCLQSSS